MKVSRADAGGLKAVMFSIDEGGRPRPVRLPSEDANPEFEVATIKRAKCTPFTIHPTASGLLIANNASLSYLIKFAYELHPPGRSRRRPRGLKLRNTI